MEASCSRPVAVIRHTGRRVGQRVCAKTSEGRGPYEPILNQAANIYAKGVEQGLNEEDIDDLVAQTIGAKDAKSLSSVQEAYKDKVKQRLEQKAAELRKKDESSEGYEEFAAGKRCYERGQYAEAEYLLTAALNKSDPFSQFGGDVQIYLALAYSALRKEDDCIALFKSLEQTHPVPAIRKQAASLCFIMEAPKLQIGEDERVKIPVVDLDPNAGKKKAVFRKSPGTVQQTRKVKKTLEEEFWDNYTPPQYLRNKYVWAASVILGIALALYSSRM